MAIEVVGVKAALGTITVTPSPMEVTQKNAPKETVNRNDRNRSITDSHQQSNCNLTMAGLTVGNYPADPVEECQQERGSGAEAKQEARQEPAQNQDQHTMEIPKLAQLQAVRIRIEGVTRWAIIPKEELYYE